jgi:DNA-binding response OmpR family regulator
MPVEQKRVLYAENNRVQLETRSKLLELEGYQVVKAGSPQEAEQAFERENLHLAILDIRLVDDNDEGDISGILLAKDERFKRVPKIIVTGYPTFEAARDVLGPAIDREPTVYAFLSKKEGPEALIEAVKSTFEKVVGIDWGLRIDWDKRGMLGFPYLVHLIETGLEMALSPARSDELEDLFRKLFAGGQQISFVRLNWLRDGCACLTLFAHQNGTARQAIAIIGRWQLVQEEHGRAKQYLAKEQAPLDEPAFAESLHYAGLVYFLTDTGAGPLETGEDFFEKAGDKHVRTALENLYQQVLPFWHQQERSEVKKADLAALYRDQLGILSRREDVENARRCLQAITESATTQSLVKGITVEGDEIEIVFPNGIFHRGPDPLARLYDVQAFSKWPAVVTTTFGGIGSQSLLIDAEGRVYPTDLASMTRSPLLDDFVAMECEFHFDRILSSNLLSRLDFEQQIGEAKTLNDALTVGNVEPECRKALAAIQTIRKLAAEAAGDALEPYLTGLFHYALNGVLRIDPQVHLAKYETVQLVHRLLAASLFVDQIGRLKGNGESPKAKSNQEMGLNINEDSHEVSVDGREARLTQTEYKLLVYLYKHPNRLCTREEILSEVFSIKEAPTENDKGLLNTHLDRLRKKIDLNPAKHRYIVTIRGEGYMLDLKP